MLKKCFSSFLLIAFINYIWGCTVTRPEKEQLERVPRSEFISSIVLISGKVLNFEKNGAEYINTNESLSGTVQGILINVPIDDISRFRTKLFTLKSLEDVRKNKVSEILTEDNRLITFDSLGAKFNAAESKYEGRNNHGENVELRAGQIKQIFSSKTESITKEEFYLNTNIKIKQALLKNGYVRTFDNDGASYIKKQSGIGGYNDDGKFVIVNPDSVLYVNIEKTDYAHSILASLGFVILSVGVLGLIALALKQSCPFIYSFDGKNYVFDGEPLGGATTKGLERYEVSKLEHIKEVDGKYKLMVRNEVDEEQFINDMKLLVVDHQSVSQVVYNFEGDPYLIDNATSATTAFDEHNNSILNFIAKEGNVTWMTCMPTDSSKISSSKRHLLTFTFPKPRDAKKVNLVYNIGTSLWGSKMIREMLNLYGENIGTWYNAIDKKGTDYQQLMNFTQREETYQLKVYIKDKNDWKMCGLINGGGPLITEKRVSTFELLEIDGDSLTIKVEPPKGFWSFNYIAANYTDLTQPQVTEIKCSRALDMKGNDISRYINRTDESYYSMPSIGDYYNLEFEVPKMKPGMVRTVFIGTSGYYKLIFPKDRTSNLAKLMSISSKPGNIVDFSNEKYIQWKNNSNKLATQSISH